jgi:endonuclease G
MKLDADLERRLDEEVFRRIYEDTLPRRFFGRYESSRAMVRSVAVSSFEEFRALEVAAPDFAIRTIIGLYKRPSLLIRNGSFSVPEGDFWRELLEESRVAIEGALPSVGKVELQDHPSLSWGGSGFLVSSDVIATNRHVADLFIVHDGQGFTWRKGTGGRDIKGRIDFREEDSVAAVEEFAITDILHIEPASGPDLALLRIESGGLRAQPLKLSTAPAEEDLVATLGYPWQDSRVAPELEEAMERIFGGVFNVKRLSPGKITKVETSTLSHDCSTLAGNSGSAVIDVETGHVVGLHYGDNVNANVAVPASVLDARLSGV